MNLSDLIAYIALFVSIYGAILSTYTAINEFFRLSLSVLDLNKTFITLTKSDEYLNEYSEFMYVYKPNLFTLIIPVRIINKSKNPTTINEIILNNKYILNSSSCTDDFIPTKFSRHGNSLCAYSSVNFDYPILKPLHEMKPLDIFEGYLIFNNIEDLPSKFDIKVKAVQKSKTFHLHFSIAKDCRNEIIQE